MKNKRFIRATELVARSLPTKAYCMHKGLQQNRRGNERSSSSSSRSPIADREYQARGSARKTTYASLPFLVNKAAPSVCEHLPSRRGKRLRLSAHLDSFLQNQHSHEETRSKALKEV